MKKDTTLKKSWVWNGDINRLIKDKVKGYSLNVCCGLNMIGDVLVDLDPKDRDPNNLLFYFRNDQRILKGDMRNLPFDNNTFDTVIQDPPWKIGFYQRMKPFFECVRVCKVGGIIIYNAYWIPKSRQVKLKDIIVRQDSSWSNTSNICIFEKIK